MRMIKIFKISRYFLKISQSHVDQSTETFPAQFLVAISFHAPFDFSTFVNELRDKKFH